MPARIGARRMEAAHTRLKGGGGAAPIPRPDRISLGACGLGRAARSPEGADRVHFNARYVRTT